MLKYLIILLADDAEPFCSYDGRSEKTQWISTDTLSRAIHLGLTENMMIQFVYPAREIPQDIKALIDGCSHVNIKPVSDAALEDIGVATWSEITQDSLCETLTIRTSLNDLICHTQTLLELLPNKTRINIVITDADVITEEDASKYGKWLDEMAPCIASFIERGKDVQLNILTDRLSLDNMRNCNAGAETITIAPDGKFYICPAFYYNEEPSVGDVTNGLDIPNARLYDLRNAPICRLCDAWHCHRCPWLNKKATLEVNTPGHIQCVLTHYERNASAKIKQILNSKGKGSSYPDFEITEYLDPFVKIK